LFEWLTYFGLVRLLSPISSPPYFVSTKKSPLLFYISKARNINGSLATPEIIRVFITSTWAVAESLCDDPSGCADLVAVIAKAIGKTRGNGVEQNGM